MHELSNAENRYGKYLEYLESYQRMNSSSVLGNPLNKSQLTRQHACLPSPRIVVILWNASNVTLRHMY